jgi:hypothetical protein
MKLNSITLGVASATATIILWVACSLLVVFLPEFMMSMTSGMMHSDVAAMSFTMTWGGFFSGLVAWTVTAGVTGWLIAVIYNQLLPEQRSSS